MRTEYAVQDQEGKLFGLPAKTFVDPSAADRTVSFLRDHLESMRLEAVAARSRLETLSPSPQEEAQLREAVARWEHEKTRQWRVVTRTVTDWEPVQ